MSTISFCLFARKTVMEGNFFWFYTDQNSKQTFMWSSDSNGARLENYMMCKLVLGTKSLGK